METLIYEGALGAKGPMYPAVISLGFMGFGELKVMEEYIPGQLHLRPELWDSRKAQLQKGLEVFVASS